jgi:hypothetical protein
MGLLAIGLVLFLGAHAFVTLRGPRGAVIARIGRTDAGAPPIPVGGRRNDVIALIGGTILYLALGLVFHPLVVGVPVLGRPAY